MKVIYYPLHPDNPRVIGEVQFTNKKIYIFYLHHKFCTKRLIETLFHEGLHILFRKCLGKKNVKLPDRILDIVDFKINNPMEKYVW